MRPADLAVPKRPNSRDLTEERTFPRTRSSSQENGVSAPPAAAWMRTRSSPRSNPESRSTTEHHSAMSLYELTKKLSDSCTWPKAPMVWRPTQ
jgi:hypothetical protein